MKRITKFKKRFSNENQTQNLHKTNSNLIQKEFYLQQTPGKSSTNDMMSSDRSTTYKSKSSRMKIGRSNSAVNSPVNMNVKNVKKIMFS